MEEGEQQVIALACDAVTRALCGGLLTYAITHLVLARGKASSLSLDQRSCHVPILRV
jgi:hypothetical protein